MKKTIKLIIILSLSLVMGSCFLSTDSDVEVAILDGSGSYDSATDTSVINFRFYVENTNILIGVVQEWRMFFIQNEAAFHLLSSETYDWLLCEDLSCENVSIQENAYALIVSAKVKGDFFEGRNPDKLYIEINILDENDNLYTINGEGPFDFTRN